MGKVCSAGVLYLSFIGKVWDNNELCVKQIDTYQNAFDFYEQSKLLLQEEKDVTVFAVLGMEEKVDKIADSVNAQIKCNFNRIVNECDVKISSNNLDCLGNTFNRIVQEYIFKGDGVRFPRKYMLENGSWKMQCFWAGHDPADKSYLFIKDVAETWVSYEKPMGLGQQIITQSFQLSDLSGRKIIGVFPDRETKEWIALLDGGVKLQLNSNVPYMRTRTGIRDIGEISMGDVDTILNNPIYSHGEWLYPTETYEEWHKIFLYAVAVQKQKWNLEDLQSVHEKFVKFIEENICHVMLVEPIIERVQYYKALLKNVLELQKYLAGEDIPVISRDMWLLLNENPNPPAMLGRIV